MAGTSRWAAVLLPDTSGANAARGATVELEPVAVVALFGRNQSLARHLHHIQNAVAAFLDLARARATVSRQRVAIITLLTVGGIDDAVTAALLLAVRATLGAGHIAIDRGTALGQVGRIGAAVALLDALATHADDLLASLPATQQRLARVVFQRLVTSDGTRAVADVDELEQLSSTPGEVRALLDHLVAARLLVVQGRGDQEGAAVEIVHESLITSWPTLRRWREESAEDGAFIEQLRGAAKQWDAKGRPVGLLWRGETMEEAQRFHRRFKGELSQRERAYLAAVVDLATRAARRKRRLIVGGFSFLSLLVVAAAIALVWISNAERAAQQQSERAQAETKRAEGETKRARSAEAEVREKLATIQKQKETIRVTEAKSNVATKQARVATELAEKATQKAQTAESERKLTYAQLEAALARARRERARAQRVAAENERVAKKNEERILGTRRQGSATEIGRREAATDPATGAGKEEAGGFCGLNHWPPIPYTLPMSRRDRNVTGAL